MMAEKAKVRMELLDAAVELLEVEVLAAEVTAQENVIAAVAVAHFPLPKTKPALQKTQALLTMRAQLVSAAQAMAVAVP